MGRLVTVFGRYAQKNTGLQGSTLSGPRMTTGFGPFELPTRGPLQKGRDHSPPKVCSEEPSFWLAHSAMGIHSAINIQITKQIGGGAQWVESSHQPTITRGMGERLTYGTGFWLAIVNFGNLESMRLILRPFLGQNDAYRRPNDRVLHA